MTTYNNQIESTTNIQDAGPADKAWLKYLPTLLRSFGAIAVLVSLYTFLARGWEGSSDLIRYSMLLGHTGLLTVIALASGHFLKEGKGARILMMLSLISAVVNFAILGAFIFSSSTGISNIAFPSYAAWTVGSMQTAILTTGLAMIVLLPVVWFGFHTLARGMSGRMTLLFLFSNLSLLLPLRDPILVTIMAIALGIFNLLFTAQTSRQRIEVKTFEGRFTILMQFLPIAVLLGRNIWLYAPDISLYTGICFMSFIILRQSSLLMNAESTLRGLLELSSVSLAVLAGILFSNTMIISGMSDSIALIIATIIAAGMCYEISMRANYRANLYRAIAVGIVTTGIITNLWIYGGLFASILTLAAGIGSIVLSYVLQQRTMFLGGILMIIAGLIDQSLHFFQFFDFGYWVTLAITGVVAIVLGSYLESRGKIIKQKFITLKHTYSEWTY